VAVGVLGAGIHSEEKKKKKKEKEKLRKKEEAQRIFSSEKGYNFQVNGLCIQVGF
jgi:hypothetical protein